MPSALLSLFNPAARLAYPHILSGVSRGLSANAISLALKTAGIGIRRQALLDIVRAVKGVESSRPVLRALKRTARPNTARLPPAAHEILRDFSYTVKVTGTDAASNYVERHITISTNNTALTRDQIEEAAMQLAGGSGDSGGLVPDSAQIVTGVRSPSLGS